MSIGPSPRGASSENLQCCVQWRDLGSCSGAKPSAEGTDPLLEQLPEDLSDLAAEIDTHLVDGMDLALRRSIRPPSR